VVLEWLSLVLPARLYCCSVVGGGTGIRERAFSQRRLTSLPWAFFIVFLTNEAMRMLQRMSTSWSGVSAQLIVPCIHVKYICVSDVSEGRAYLSDV
jgi:hypothetical protein